MASYHLPVSAVTFVQSLLEIGRVKVPPDGDPPRDLAEAVALLDESIRPTLAYAPPPLSLPAATWAMTIVFRAAQILVFRDIKLDRMSAALSQPCPQPPSPSVCYSADLGLRYLPDLFSLARGIAADDPLVTALASLARAWPLSSVGIADLGTLDPAPFLEHPSLLQLYVDRIIERNDASRLSHPVVRAAVREAIGAYPELAPKLAPVL